MSAVALRACWLCDGTLREHDGVSVESLGGVAVHKRCLPALGVDRTPPTVATDADPGTSD